MPTGVLHLEKALPSLVLRTRFMLSKAMHVSDATSDHTVAAGAGSACVCNGALRRWATVPFLFALHHYHAATNQV